MDKKKITLKDLNELWAEVEKLRACIKRLEQELCTHKYSLVAHQEGYKNDLSDGKYKW